MTTTDNLAGDDEAAGGDALARPDSGAVGHRAATILAAIRADKGFERLAATAGMHAHCWCAFNGYPIVADFDLSTDTDPLLCEAFKVLSLKAAVLELSEGDETAAELMVPVAVDEMIHAVLVQQPLAVQLQHRLGITFVHMTEHERFGWEPGDYTEHCYRAAGWGNPPAPPPSGCGDSGSSIAATAASASSTVAAAPRSTSAPPPTRCRNTTGSACGRTPPRRHASPPQCGGGGEGRDNW